MNVFLSYIAGQYQAFCGLIIGILMLLVAGAINSGDTKLRTLKWIAKYICKNSLKSDIYSKRFLEGITIYLLIVGPMLIILAVYFLRYIR